MTEKIIIDGVDVSGCEYFDNPDGWCKDNETEFGCGVCEDIQKCYFKQLQRTTSQYDAVLEQNKSLQTESKQKEHECERMRVALNKIRNYELGQLDIDWDEYETCCRETEYSPIIDYCEVGLGEVEDD